MGPSSAEIICASGACDRIVGVSKFCVYPPELAGRPQVGGLYDPDLERIAALRPDLLVTRGRNDAVERLCEQRGIAVYHDTTDSLAGIGRTVRELGAMLGLEAEAADVNQAFHKELDAIRERVADRPRPRVFLTVSRQPDRLANILTAGKGTFLHEMLEIAGGENVFGHLDMAYPEVSPEAILAARPDVIIELMPEGVAAGVARPTDELPRDSAGIAPPMGPTPDLERQMREHWRDLGDIPAVAHDRIFFLTDDHCLIPSPRYHQIISKVSRILHPN